MLHKRKGVRRQIRLVLRGRHPRDEWCSGGGFRALVNCSSSGMRIACIPLDCWLGGCGVLGRRVLRCRVGKREFENEKNFRMK